MGWTDERVELLKKLWLEGLAASQIAKQLGGVTRNAVIGKVHRLGLSGRATPSQPSRPTFKTPRPPRPISHATPRRLEPQQQPLPAPVYFVEEPAGRPWAGRPPCKWPSAIRQRPASPSAAAVPTATGPTAWNHARIAYQPQQPRKRSAVSELTPLAAPLHLG